MKTLYQIFCPKQWGAIKNTECRTFAEKYFDYIMIIGISYVLGIIINSVILFYSPKLDDVGAYVFISAIPFFIILFICVHISDKNHKRILEKEEPFDGIDDGSKMAINKFRILAVINIICLILISVLMFYL